MDVIKNTSNPDEESFTRFERFQELPVEVRQRIYFFLFRDKVFQVHNPQTIPARNRTFDKSSRAILFASKTIYGEAYSVYLHEAIFVIGHRCDRHEECNALKYVHDVSLLNEFRRVWFHWALVVDIVLEIGRLEMTHALKSKLKEIRMWHSKRTLRKVVNCGLVYQNNIERYGTANPENIEIGAADRATIQMCATPLDYEGETFKKGLYRHECEMLSFRKNEICISARSLPPDQRVTFEWQIRKAYVLRKDFPIVFEDIKCGACESLQQPLLSSADGCSK